MSDLPTEIEGLEDGEEPDLSTRPSQKLRRDAELVGGSRAKIRTPLDKLCDDIGRGFEDQKERADDQARFWEAYHCIINECQYYHGIAEIFLPIIHDAVNARATRFVNQMFPQGGRSVEAVSTDGTRHASLVGLLEHYLRESQFETMVMKPLCRNGDIEGQYNLYVEWLELTRHLVSRKTHPPLDEQTGAELPGEDIIDIIEEEVVIGRPAFEVLHDSDVLVLPQTADSIEEALEYGGAVAIVHRWSKAKIDAMVKSGEIKKDEGKALKEAMGKIAEGEANVEKKLVEHVNINAKGSEATVWEVWTKLPLDKMGSYSEDGDRLLCRVYFGPGKAILGAKRNPYWNDRCPLLSAPVEKVSGVFKGMSLIQHVASLQYEANDAVNEGADAATLSAGPIIRRDTEKTNTVPVLAIGAVWDAPKDAFELMAFPDLTPRAVTRVQMALQAIFQSLGVNPSMLPQQTRAGKPNQAQIAQEQQVDLLTTAEGVKVLASLASQMLGLMVDFDYQFRDKPLLVRAFGDMGRMAVIEEVAPLQNRAGFSFTWRGAEQVKMMAMMQQQGTAFLNVMRSMRPELSAEGIQLRIAPVLEAAAQGIFGAVLGSQTIVDMRQQLTLDAQMEVEMMLDGFETHPHPLDNDQQKIQAFHQALMSSGDPHGTIRVRLAEQMRQMQAKSQAMMQRAAMQQGQGNGPPGGQPHPGGPGMPQPGAVPAGPRQIKGPPGAVHPDRGPASGVIAMPRRN